MHKKILVLEPYLDQLGGSERVAFEVAKGLAEKGWEIHLGFVKNGIWRRRYSTFVKDFHKISPPALTIRNPWQVAKSAFKLNKKLKKEGISVVFSSCIAYVLSLAFLKIFFGIKSCLHLGLGGTAFNTIGWRWAIGRISAGVAPSKHTLKTWQEIGWPDKRLHVVPNWIDWEEYSKLPTKEEAREMLGISDMGYGISGEKRKAESENRLKVVAYVGRLVEEKGIEVLLEAWNRGFAQDEDAVLLVAGTGKPEYEDKLKAKAARNVKFLGGLPDTKPVYRASDLTVVPSLWEEPFGLVPLEAVACGSVPLVSNRGFLPEFVENERKSLKFLATDRDELKNKISKLLSKNLSSLLMNVKKQCELRFSKEKGVKEYEKILNRL